MNSIDVWRPNDITVVEVSIAPAIDVFGRRM